MPEATMAISGGPSKATPMRPQTILKLFLCSTFGVNKIFRTTSTSDPTQMFFQISHPTAPQLWFFVFSHRVANQLQWGKQMACAGCWGAPESSSTMSQTEAKQKEEGRQDMNSFTMRHPWVPCTNYHYLATNHPKVLFTAQVFPQKSQPCHSEHSFEALTLIYFFSSAGARDRVIAVANVGDKCESCTL